VATRTSILGRGNFLAAGFQTLFTVPAGETWILKRIDAINNAGATQTVQLIARDPTNVISAVLLNASYASGVGGALELWFVLQGGDTLRGSLSVGNVGIWLSGSRLVGVA